MDTPVPLTPEVDDYVKLVIEEPDIATKRQIALAGLAACRARLREEGVSPFSADEILSLIHEGRKPLA